MKNNKKEFCKGIGFLLAFAVWTIMIQIADVKPAGVNGTCIGFASVNIWFHSLTGVHMTIYTITDWLGLVPIMICVLFGIVGLTQIIKRKSIFKVDKDIILLGFYYVTVIFAYLIFEMIPINYRPILIGGFMEASYPSSTTLLVLSVMPTLKFQIDRRSNHPIFHKLITVFVVLFSAFMVIGRLLAGVHWCTDIIGSVLLSVGLFYLYRFSVYFVEQKNSERSQEADKWSSEKNCSS